MRPRRAAVSVGPGRGVLGALGPGRIALRSAARGIGSIHHLARGQRRSVETQEAAA